MMRRIQSCVLRLLRDVDHPTELRGMVNSIEDDTEYSFKDEQGLLRILRQMVFKEHKKMKGDPQ